MNKVYEATSNTLAALDNVNANLLSSYTYSLDALGRRGGVLEQGDAFGGDTPIVNWKYDAKGQVVSADSSAGTGTSDDRYYAFDAIGNRTDSRTGTASASGGTITNWYADVSAAVAGGNALNQYEAIATISGTVNPLHDDDGNLIDDGATWDFTWDGENRLVSATPTVPTSGLKKVNYYYDHLGRLFEVNCARQPMAWRVPPI